MQVLEFFRQLAGKNRSTHANRQLGIILAFVAGAVNAGGFLAVHQYTSHMTGFVSSMADSFVLGDMLPVIAGIGSVISFICGAATTGIIVNWARPRALHATYALILTLEAALLLLFGLLGANLDIYFAVTVPITVVLLCFIMGLQNAVMTKMSNAEIRTTHLTGVVTDIGIELGRMLYWNHRHKRGSTGYVRARRDKLIFYFLLLTMFFVGGILGAIGFKQMGYGTVLPLAILLFLLALVPLIDDAMMYFQDRRRGQ